MERRPTIYDVARAAGVAASTVSRAFARPGRVIAETAARIFEAARDLGYRASALPGLTTSRTKTLALVVTDITNPFYAEIIRGAHEAAADLGYTLSLSHTQEDAEVERAWIEHELSSVEGMVLASSRMSDSTIRTLAKQKPVVVLNRRLPEVPCLLVDNARGTRRALEHLGELGHTSVTYVGGPESSWTDGTRWQALREAGFELDIKVRRIGPTQKPTIDAGFARVREILAQPTTAVIAYNDVLAIGVIKGLHRVGVKVPDDISVIGFDNVLLAEVIEPELTTVAAPLRQQGETAVRNLVALTQGAHTTSREPLVMPVHLVVRRSTAQRSRKRTSPALGTTNDSSSASSAARSMESGST
ncbi:LacI family transcription regulator [Knoellia sinensis KCTC 19936]|uniref:LacI family transcription regulator n=1 Tax=Knoellia sinensis KCTC 19936 TaxID=1385520 RepID=A0A0A0J438_9MICO|nr:LacI family DNA-binding transcriptional regulator [Knoellia sinensis]KGN30887.1 LacI family transcription regulator [Knoellia sinensis KCTC 19936]